MNIGLYSRCSRCEKVKLSREMARPIPGNPELAKRLQGTGICPTCVGVMVMEYREQGCPACTHSADVLERTMELLDRFRQTGVPQALPVSRSGIRHRKTCPNGPERPLEAP